MTAGSRDGRPRTGALIGYVVSDEMLDELTRIDPTPAIQTHRFGLVLLELLGSSFDRFDGYSFVPVQDYPIGRRIGFGGGTHDRGGRTVMALPFINLMVAKHVSRFAALLSRYPVMRRLDVAVVHGLHLPNLLAALLLKASGVRIGIVLTDQQGIILPTDGRIRRLLKGIDRRLSVGLARRFDFAIALSDTLAATYAPGRPALVVPGIYDDTLEERVDAVSRSRSFDGACRVLYFGGLSPEYGIAALLDAVPLLDPGIEVRLFGRGPLEPAIAAMANRHPALVWGGLVDQARLLEEMANADILINPRPAGGTLARMSSPSKLIEYAASGRAVMTTRLPSLSDELIDAVLPIDDETPAGIAAAINAAARQTPAMLAARGNKFRARVRGRYAIDALRVALSPLLRAETPAREPASPDGVEGR